MPRARRGDESHTRRWTRAAFAILAEATFPQESLARERMNERATHAHTHTWVYTRRRCCCRLSLSFFLFSFGPGQFADCRLFESLVSQGRAVEKRLLHSRARARAFVVVGVYTYIVDVERVSLYTTQLCARVCVSTLLSRLFIRYSCAAVANGSSSRIFRSSFYFSLPLSKVTRRGIAIRCSYVQFCRRTYVRVCVSMGFAFF